MTISRDDRIRMERAHVWAWPALETRLVDGWLWRCSGGGSQRANSVSTVDYTGDDVSASVDQVEALYAARAAPARLQTFDETAPAGLTTLLRNRGYVETESTITMFRAPSVKASQTDGPELDIWVRDQAWDDWCAVYLSAITESRRAANLRIVQDIPPERRFFGCRRDGMVIATALCVVHSGCAVVECVATAADYRRQGAARAVVAAALEWGYRNGADCGGLQVSAGNTGAIALYQSMGFVAGASNRFWVREAQ